MVSQFASAGAMAGTLDHSVPVQEVIETCQEFPAQRISATLIARSVSKCKQSRVGDPSS